ncbi:HAD family hydrolase [Psychromicrobium xiongbiense]|uniref:HAD family hydrolase n=1 Tax=Psychromicrobium xiongbiense TaxID=3051184 RepID=UPI002557B0F9|nr:Cof-type HAD-IIB family hydrolase [Psychromicrobium sp. YIM S02556]
MTELIETTASAVPGIDDRTPSALQATRNTTRQGTKLVALDVDGTLVDHDGTMSDAVREAARNAASAGHRLIIATGRSLGATLPVVKLLGLGDGHAVSCNGGVTVRLDSSREPGYEVLHRATFTPATALSALRATLPEAMFAVETATGAFLSTSSFQDASFGIEAQAVNFEDLLSTEAVRVVVHSREVPLDEFELAVRGVGLHGVTYSVGWSSWLDIAAEGVTKATALEALRRSMGIAPEDTVAIGDGFNDVEMLRWAGRGVAMGQAPDGVREVASEVTASVYDDGAARVLRSLI